MSGMPKKGAPYASKAETPEQLESELRAFLSDAGNIRLGAIGKSFGEAFHRLGMMAQHKKFFTWVKSLKGIECQAGERKSDPQLRLTVDRPFRKKKQASAKQLNKIQLPIKGSKKHGAFLRSMKRLSAKRLSCIQAVKSFLKSHGGHAMMGVIGSRFKVKKEQLQAMGFIMGPPDAHGQFEVTMSGRVGDSLDMACSSPKLPPWHARRHDENRELTSSFRHHGQTDARRSGNFEDSSSEVAASQSNHKPWYTRGEHRSVKSSRSQCRRGPVAGLNGDFEGSPALASSSSKHQHRSLESRFRRSRPRTAKQRSRSHHEQLQDMHDDTCGSNDHGPHHASHERTDRRKLELEDKRSRSRTARRRRRSHHEALQDKHDDTCGSNDHGPHHASHERTDMRKLELEDKRSRSRIAKRRRRSHHETLQDRHDDTRGTRVRGLRHTSHERTRRHKFERSRSRIAKRRRRSHNEHPPQDKRDDSRCGKVGHDRLERRKLASSKLHGQLRRSYNSKSRSPCSSRSCSVCSTPPKIDSVGKQSPTSRQSSVRSNGGETMPLPVQADDVFQQTSDHPERSLVDTVSQLSEDFAKFPEMTKPAPSECRAARRPDEEGLEVWLRDLDGGRGSMLQFLEPLQREFGDRVQLAAAVTPVPAGVSIIKAIEPGVFEVLGVKSTGHRLMLAKGMLALASAS